MTIDRILFTSAFISLIGISNSQAELNDLGNGMIEDTARNVTLAKDANLVKTACDAVSGIEQTLWETFKKIHPNIAQNSGRSPEEICADNGRLNWHEAEGWVDVLNRLGYLGKYDWRQPATGLPQGAPAPQQATLDDNVIIHEDIGMMASITQAEGVGQIVFDADDVPQSWAEGKVVILPDSLGLPGGLAIKIDSIIVDQNITTVSYSTPSIDDVFLNANIQNSSALSLGMITAFRAMPGVSMLAQLPSSTAAEKDANAPDFNIELEWLPDTGKFNWDASQGTGGQLVDTLKIALNDVILVRDKNNAENQIKLSGGIEMSDVTAEYEFSIQENNGIADINTLKSGAQLGYTVKTDINMDAHIEASGTGVDALGVGDKFSCSKQNAHEYNGSVININIEGASWPKTDLCLAAITLSFDGVSVKKGAGGVANIKPSIDIYLILGVDFNLSIQARWNFSKTSKDSRGAWLDMATTQKLRVVNSSVTTQSSNIIEGNIDGDVLLQTGVAFAVNIMGIKPVIARGMVGVKADADAQLTYGSGGSSILCAKGNIEAGLSYSVHLGASVEASATVFGWTKEIINKEARYNYAGELDPFLQKSYNGCEPDTLTYQLSQTSDALTFSDIALVSTAGNALSIANTGWAVYQKEPFELQKTGTGTTVATDALDGGQYVLVVTTTDSAGSQVLRYDEFSVGPKDTGASVLNNTGITWGATSSTNNSTCTGDTISAQDCSHGRDVTHNDNSDGHAGFSFTKLDSNGNDLAASASEWSCVKDNVTGLIWEVKTNDDGLRDKDWGYTWYNSTGVNDGGSAGTANGGSCFDSTHCDTEKFVQQVNSQGLCGKNDWRMPTIKELENIVNFNSTSPAIDTDYFPNTKSSYFWSASPSAGNSDSAWYVSFFNGFSYYYSKNNSNYVRLVRKGQ